MARISEESKQRNKEQLLMLLKRHHGLREVEIEDILHIHRRTLNNYLNELEREGKVYKDGFNWFADPEAGRWLRRFELTAAETFALYLPARMFVKQSDKQNDIVLSALSRLAEVLKTDLPVDEQIFEAVQELRTREKRPSYESHFTDLIHAYLRRNPVTISYSTSQGFEFETTFHTYLVEPSAIGYTLYFIGHSQHVNDIRAYKIERIMAVDVDHDNHYQIPEKYRTPDFLKNAWSIISGDNSERVLLRFSKKVKARVLETIWHPAQDYEDEQEDGSLLWWVDIASTIDMEPWIRSWGSDVEVLEPEHLRETIKAHLRRSAKTYGIAAQTGTSPTTRLLRLWGKTSKHTELFHPALYHMFDVAHIAQQLLSPRTTSRWSNVLAHTLNADAATLHEWLPYLIALHDIGKLSPPFQTLNTKQWERLDGEGFKMGRPGQQQHHTRVGRLLLNDYTAVWPTNLRHAFLDMVSGHHGIYQPEERHDQEKFDFIQEPPEWTDLRQQAMLRLESYLCQHWPQPLPNPSNVSAAIAALNGFCILCDWLGSDGAYFTPKPTTPLPEYVLHSRQKALERVRDAGLFQTAVSKAATTFTQLFHDFTTLPRPLQQTIEQIPIGLLVQPSLTIIEAPTGEGKTEAALLLARRIAAQRGTDEMYIALPTTATSNAMHDRITDHLEKRLGLKTAVQLIHGQSFLKEDDIEVNSLVNGENPDEDEAAENWFAPKKKALLAPVGVGTIDQAELSALNVHHNALRLIGLAGKTIILDEVHAYDTYMTTIIKRMLNWLSALGSSVVLLSATLPQAKRRELMVAYAPDVDTTAVSLATYPNIITITATDHYTPTDPIAVFQPDKTIQLDTLTLSDEQAQEKADWLLAQVKEGGCVCWITNTVNRAQAIFERLPQNASIDLTLLHSRFPLAQRQAIETDILAKYGKPSDSDQRPQRGIVIGTQVLEQSLDLDFDLMVTDIAPIDLILQRTGRLHRHQRDLADRYYHTSPHLFINRVREPADQHIYSDYILRMTERALHNKNSFILPTDYRELVEAVYTETKPDKKDDELYQAWRKSYIQSKNLRDEASLRLSGWPDEIEPFYEDRGVKGLHEDEDSAAWLVAQTRWSERETLTLIPLVSDQETAVIPHDPSKNIPLTTKAAREDQLRLLRHNLRVSQPQLVAAIKAEQNNQSLPLFQSALLKNTHPLWLTPVAGETVVYINHHLDQPVYLHPKLGLVFSEYQGE